MFPNPTYQGNDAVTSGQTGYAEVTKLVYNPEVLPLKKILVKFWENHDPTHDNAQGGDRGTQYRSAIWYVTEEQRRIAEESKQKYDEALEASPKEGKDGAPPEPRSVKTTIQHVADHYYHFAEEMHQQYDSKPGSRE